MSQSQPEVDAELRKWASYHGLEDILYGEDKTKWPQQNSALHAGDLAETPLSGLAADRPATPPDGAFYRALDEGTVSQYDDAADEWAVVSESGGAGAVLAATAGDAASVQTQLDTAGGDGGGTVYVPAGDYPIGDTFLKIESGTRLVLAPGATIRRTNSNRGLMLVNSRYQGEWFGDIEVVGGTWDVNGANVSGSASGLVFRDADDIHVRNVTVKNVNSYHGLTLGGVHRASVRGGRFHNPISMGDVSGMIQMEADNNDTRDCEDVLIDGVHFTQGGGAAEGAAIDSHHNSPAGAQQRGVTIRDCVVEDYVTGFFLEDTEEPTLRGNTMRGVTGDGVLLDSNVVDARLSGNRWGGASVSDSGARTVVDGVGTNTGDPSAAGEWSGQGFEGALVYDTSVARPFDAYRYINGQWQQA